MAFPDITIAVCTFNRAPMLRDALASLMTLQTRGQFASRLAEYDSRRWGRLFPLVWLARCGHLTRVTSPVLLFHRIAGRHEMLLDLRYPWQLAGYRILDGRQFLLPMNNRDELLLRSSPGSTTDFSATTQRTGPAK